jgi:hypothetical protein
MFWVLKIATLREYPYKKQFIFFSEGTAVQCGTSCP